MHGPLRMGGSRISWANLEHEGRGEGAARMRDEERRGGNGGAEMLSWGKNRGEQDERYHIRGSHYRSEKRSNTREISIDLQG